MTPPGAPDLPRKLSFFDGAALLVGSVIGSGIFVVPSLIAQRVPEPGMVIAIWVFSGLLVLCGALTLAELGTMLPHSGGLYVYMREAYGPFWAYLYGWTIMLVAIPSSVAALTSAFLLYLKLFIPLTLWAEKVLGLVLLVALGFINTRGVKQGAGVQNLFTILKVSGLVLLIGLAIVTGQGSAANLQPLFPPAVSIGLLSAVGLAMVSTLFAYDGWQFVSFVAGEIRDPQRNVPRSIVLGVLIVIAVYVSANLAYYFVLGPARIAGSQRVAADAMSAMVGPAGATIITLAIVCSTFGAISANVLAGPRVFYAMARDGVFFPALADVHPRFQTPANAIWALSIWAGVLTLTGGYEHLITMSGFANWIFFTMVVLSVIVLRRRHPEWERPYRVVGYPFTVIVFVLVSSVFVLNTLVEAPASSLMGLGLLLVGIPFYRRQRQS
ncbi:MAG: amino acid permease [Acidobacteria bacterium]|nr:amino acid permease [Acidobacteriota bacterium]